MDKYGEPELHNWIESRKSGASLVLAGSAGPPRTLEDLKAISKDPEHTAKVLRFDGLSLSLGEPQGDPKLRELIAGFYDKSKVNITADDVVISNGTTGALSIAFHSLLRPGDHVICLYPAYEGLLHIPEGLGAEVSRWRMDENNDWKANIEDLKKLIRADTKMIILNNPHNPTGAVISTAEQAEVVKLAAQHNITVFTDEIFRPLFHGCEKPTSIVEHNNYDKTIAVGSLSKVWGFSGVRIGWIVTRNHEFRERVIKTRTWDIQSVSVMDEHIAKEILSDRCCQPVIDVTLANADANVETLEAFVKENKEAVWSFIPKGASTAFVKFMNPKTGGPVDDVRLCQQLYQQNILLLAPGSLTFGDPKEGNFKGFVRMHVSTAPEKFKKGIQALGQYITANRLEELSLSN